MHLATIDQRQEKTILTPQQPGHAEVLRFSDQM